MKDTNEARANERIRAKELRVIGADGENLGVMLRDDAIAKAREFGLDLIEISPNAAPPIAKISDFGKYLYQESKKQKAQKAKSHSVEVKALQIKIGTGDHDLMLKAKKASEWLEEGHKTRIELFLPGRAKYLDFNFLKERLERVLKLITVPYKITEEAKKGPKGVVTVIEKAK